MAPIHFAFAKRVFSHRGFKMEILPEVNRETIEEGLRYVNNDVCYPAIVTVGQLVQAIKSGKYDPTKTALLISQACGGCRSTNYATFLKIAAEKAGFPEVPIIPFSFNVTHTEESEGITVGLGMLRELAYAFLYGDVLMHLANHCRPYETQHGETEALTEKWIAILQNEIVGKRFHSVSRWAKRIIQEFEAIELIPLAQQTRPKVGIVGEILVKYHPGANRGLVALIEREGGEAVVPEILDFVLYCLKSDIQSLRYAKVPFFSRFKSALAIRLIESEREKVRKILRQSKRFTMIGNIEHLISKAKPLVSLCNHTGEGWLLTAEMVELIESGAPNIVCVQPFGCLPNHITGKGVMKTLRNRFPHANITTIDYDPGTTEVNQLNRIKLMMAVAERNAKSKPETTFRTDFTFAQETRCDGETVVQGDSAEARPFDLESAEVQMSRKP